MNRNIQTFRVETETAGEVQVNVLPIGSGGLVTVGKPIKTSLTVIRKVVWVSDLKRELVHLIPN